MENKYFAFISYNSKDTAWGKKLQKKLEHYKLPATLCSEHGWSRKPISPVFFAPTDIQPGGLTEELQERLKALAQQGKSIRATHLQVARCGVRLHLATAQAAIRP